MRRRLPLAVFFLVGTVLARPGMAQNDITLITPKVDTAQTPGNTAFGIVGGLDFSHLALSDGNALANAKDRTQFAGGVFFTLGLGRILAIQPEVLLSMKGTAASNPTQNFTTGDLTLSMNYIQIPLLLKGYLPLGNANLRPNLFVGPTIAFLVSCRVGEDVQGGTRDCSNGGPDINSTDTTIMFGGGVDFMRNFTAQIRYDLGLTDVDEDSGTAKNRSLLLMVGYVFQL